jgi:hypothetical protein
MKEFATKMEKLLGMKILILSGHLDTKGTVSLSAYVHISPSC